MQVISGILDLKQLKVPEQLELGIQYTKMNLYKLSWVHLPTQEIGVQFLGQKYLLE